MTLKTCLELTVTISPLSMKLQLIGQFDCLLLFHVGSGLMYNTPEHLFCGVTCNHSLQPVELCTVPTYYL